MRIDKFQPEFVEFVPSKLDSGKLYISMSYATTVHLCASGCGNKVILPLSPAEWQMYFDGEAVSLSPSVGNWEYPCQSHYWIRKNKVQWAGRWSEERIERGRKHDQEDLEEYFESKPKLDRLAAREAEPGFWSRLFKFFKSSNNL